MLSNVSTKASRISIPQLVADYHVEPFFADLEALLEGRWREEPTDVGTAFVATSDNCRVLTDDGVMPNAPPPAIPVNRWF